MSVSPFSYIDNEREIVKKVNKKISFKDNIETKKKRRELFHLYVFMSVTKQTFLLCRRKGEAERPDFILRKPLRKEKIGLELVEVHGDSNEYSKSKEVLDGLLNGENIVAKDLLTNRSSNAIKSFRWAVDDKHQDLEGGDWKTVDRKVLLIVTYELKNNPEAITGHWYERFLSNDILIKNAKRFDNIFFLNYGSSGKDGGPTVLDIKTVLEWQKAYYHE